MARHIIRKMRLAHGKRGPARCEKCRELDLDRICVLEIDPKGDIQRRVVQLQDGGAWHELEIVRTFQSEQLARDPMPPSMELRMQSIESWCTLSAG
jgi:hypothetical protein